MAEPEAALAAAAWAAFDRRAEEVERGRPESRPALACRAGCAHCCHSIVSVLPQEAFALAAHIESAMPEPERETLKARVIAHAGRTAQMGGAARMRARIACPFLDGETALCRVHPARPLTCRGMNSVDEAACRAALDDPAAEVAAPTVLAHHRAVQNLYDQNGARLSSAGLSAASLELTGALAIIWSEPGALARWGGHLRRGARRRYDGRTDSPVLSCAPARPGRALVRRAAGPSSFGTCPRSRRCSRASR